MTDVKARYKISKEEEIKLKKLADQMEITINQLIYKIIT